MTTTSSASSAVLRIDQCDETRLDLVGGKAAALGALTRAGFQVPSGFAVTTNAYRDWLGVRAPSLQAEFFESVEVAYAELCAGAKEIPVAVRSSATVEDSSAASCAGQFLTFLGASGSDAVVGHIEDCWLSAAGDHVAAYRADRDLDGADDGIAVVVQELVEARVAGVLFTQHPRTGDRSLVVIEANYGLGESVVSGEVTPDLFEINKITCEVQQRTLGTKELEHRLAADRCSVEVREVELLRQGQWALNEAELTELLQLAGQMEATFGRGLDIEWAIGTTDAHPGVEKLYVLQKRPITVAAPTPRIDGSGAGIDMVLGSFGVRG